MADKGKPTTPEADGARQGPGGRWDRQPRAGRRAGRDQPQPAAGKADAPTGPSLRPERIQERAREAATPNRRWAAAVGLDAGDGAAGAGPPLTGRELEAALAALPEWDLVEEGGTAWLARTFHLSAFEGAALFVNFLLASVQMTTCSVAPKIVAGSDGEVTVQLTDPDAGGVSARLAFFASLIGRGFYLSEEKRRDPDETGEAVGAPDDREDADGDP